MPRFFVTSCQIENGTVTLTGDDAHHISRALRMAVGEEIVACDEAGVEYVCRLSEFLPDKVRATVQSSMPGKAEMPVSVILYQALPKGDKMDTVIQKAVECGVTRIVPFESSRCMARVKAEGEERKRERRARIALEAAKQCGRCIVPQVETTVGFSEMLSRASKADFVLFCYEGEGTVPLGRLLDTLKPKAGATVALVIGSEGGFSPEEARAAGDAGFLLTGLGPRILRTETASGFALACISCCLELL